MVVILVAIQVPEHFVQYDIIRNVLFATLQLGSFVLSWCWFSSHYGNL